VLTALRDGLRLGDVHVPGSRRYADAVSFLLAPRQWEPQRLEYCHLVGKQASAADAGPGERRAPCGAGGPGGPARPGRREGRGPPQPRRRTHHPVIAPLTVEDVPAEAGVLRDELATMLPRVPIASVRVEIDARTGFTGLLTHASGKASRPSAATEQRPFDNRCAREHPRSRLTQQAKARDR
jgi:hypothetical protein